VQWNLDVTNHYRYNEVLGMTKDVIRLSNSKIYGRQPPDITKPRFSEHILPVPWPFVILRFHYIHLQKNVSRDRNGSDCKGVCPLFFANLLSFSFQSHEFLFVKDIHFYCRFTFMHFGSGVYLVMKKQKNTFRIISI